MVIKIYVKDKLEHVGCNEFVAMNNYMTYCDLYGMENVKVERSEQDFGEALKEKLGLGDEQNGK